MELTNPSTLAQLLKKHGLYTQKQFGQNFLINSSVITDSLHAANITAEDIVVEIGVGAGTLTRALAARAHKVVAFEVDTSLKPLLDETLSDFQNITLLFNDIKQVNLIDVLQDNFQQLPDYKVVANLPYNAGTHIISQLMQLPHPPQSITVLLQREVAEKITAQAPHATYLSNYTQAYGAAEIVRIVNPGSFLPSPKVHSAILHIQRHSIANDVQLLPFSGFLHRGFANPRKKINKAFSIEELQQAGIDPNLRPENLTFDQWCLLYKAVSKTTHQLSESTKKA